jgi:hypothetical protein
VPAECTISTKTVLRWKLFSKTSHAALQVTGPYSQPMVRLLSQETHTFRNEVSAITLSTIGNTKILMGLVGSVVVAVLATAPDVYLVAPSHLRYCQKPHVSHTVQSVQA